MDQSYESYAWHHQKIIDIARSHRDTSLEITALSQWLKYAPGFGHYEDIGENISRLAELVKKEDDPRMSCYAYSALATSLTKPGDWVGAGKFLNAYLKAVERLHDRNELLRVLSIMSETHKRYGEWEASRKYSDRRLEILERSKNSYPTST